MARAIRPSSTVKVSVFEMLSGDRNAGLIAAKTAISRIKSTRGPNSGADMVRRRVDVCVKSGHRRKGAGERRQPEGRQGSGSVPASLGAGRGTRSGLLARHHLVVRVDGRLVIERADSDVEARGDAASPPRS